MTESIERVRYCEENGIITSETFDYSSFLADIFKPGRNLVTDGERGGGKTHTSIAYAQAILSGKYPFDKIGRVVLLTNVIFLRKDSENEEDYVRGTPDNVYHINSMEQMFRIIAKLMKQYKRNITFLVVLDEAQNYLLADANYEETSQNFTRMYGMTRKFNMCLWTLTPSISNLPPRARNFPDNPTEPGYVSVRFNKNKTVALNYIKKYGSDKNWKQFITIYLGTGHKPTNPMYVPVTPWTMQPEELPIGAYFYDHKSCADFTTSTSEKDEEKFNFRAFIKACSNVSSYELPDAMQRFFDRMDGKVIEPEDEALDPISLQAERIMRMRKEGLKWDVISKIEYDTDTGKPIPVTTLQSRVKKYITLHKGSSDNEREGGDSLSKPSKMGKTMKKSVSSKNQTARQKNDDEKGEGPARVYIENSTHAQNGGKGENSSFSSPEKNDPKDTPFESVTNGLDVGDQHSLPDGKYDKDEFDRAVKYTIGTEDEDNDET